MPICKGRSSCSIFLNGFLAVGHIFLNIKNKFRLFFPAYEFLMAVDIKIKVFSDIML